MSIPLAMSKETPTVFLEPLFHREQHLVAIRFLPHEILRRVVDALPNRKFSITHRCWYVLNTDTAVVEIENAFSGVAVVDSSAFRATEQKPLLTPDQLRALRLMEQKLVLKGYSHATAKTYLDQFKLFVLFFSDSHPLDLEESEIRVYLLHLIERKKLSRSAQNQAINAIKFFYEKVMQQERKVYYLERPIREKRLPEILSQEEVLKLFEAAGNVKHKAMLMVIYAAGLRRGELLRLRKGDIDLNRKTVFVRGGKGHKDRQSILSANLVPVLETYLTEHEPLYWFFEGRDGQRYSESSLNQVLKDAAEKAGIRKNVHLHMLRHSFATHLLESGTATRYIQVLLGHESPKTTEIYAQVTKFGMDKVRSPLDQLNLEDKHLKERKE
jgi:integrase/recombinase XerD